MAYRPSLPFLLTAAVLAMGAAPPAGEPYPARADELSPATRAICDRAATARPPAGDWPTAAEARALRGCSSEALYYGIGRRADPVKARKCALLEFQRDPTMPSEFAGAGLLMLIYANGRGARRDLDVAIHMQCAMTAAPVDTDTLVEALARRKASGERGAFDYCLEVEQGRSNTSIAACHGLASQRAAAAREAKIAAALHRLPPTARAAYPRLSAAEAAFIAARSAGEHRDGVIHRTDPLIFSDEVLNDDAKLLSQMSQGRPPQATKAARAGAEGRLANQYKMFLRDLATPEAYDGLTADGLRQAQAAWTIYRDAWVALARTHWPAPVADGVARRLADRRIDMLRCVAWGDDNDDPKLMKLCR